LPLGFGFPSIIRDHSTPTAKKNVRHKNLFFRRNNGKLEKWNSEGRKFCFLKAKLLDVFCLVLSQYSSIPFFLIV
jgi:hypothetical protein